MSDLQRYPKKLCLIKYELDINVFVSLNCLFLFEVGKKLTEINTFRVKKKLIVSSKSLIRDKVSMVPLKIVHFHLCMEGHLELHVQSL